MASSSSNAFAPARAVSIEDEPVVKQCSACLEDWAVSEYSGAQLKKKGKRVCNACIDKKTKTTAAAVAAASAAAVVAALSRQQETEFNRATVLPASALASCIVCKRIGTKLRKCSKCDSSYCSLPCLQQHVFELFFHSILG